MSGEEDSNRRQYRRITSSQRCWCEAGEVTLYAQMGNISEGGIFLKTLAPLGEGTTTRIRFAPSQHTAEIEAEAVVVWRRDHANGQPAGMGLQFVGLAPGQRDVIRDYIHRESEATDS